MTLKTATGPRGHFLFGHIGEYQRNRFEFEERLQIEHGDVAAVNFAGRPAVFISHPDLVHEVMVTKADKIHKSVVYKVILTRFLGMGLLTSDGEFWKRQRRLVQPAFHTKRIQAYGDVMVNFAEAMLNDWQGGQERDINRDMMRLTLNVVSKTLFNVEMDQNAARVNQALTTVLHATDEMITSPIFIPDWVPTPRNRRMKQAVQALDDIIAEIIHERRASSEDLGDLLSMLLLTEGDDGERMTDQQVRDEAVTLFLAGHETTANALTWAWYLLSQHPEVEAKLHEEIDRVLGGRMPNLNDLRQLEYTEMVIKETMRLYPPIPTLGRQTAEAVQIGDYPLPKGTIILLSPYRMHHDPRWWDEAESFRPERFSKENEKQHHKYAYIPFAGGPRVCIGNSFAMMEAVLVLAAMAQQYQLRLSPGQTVIPEPTLTLRPKGELRMRLERRESAVSTQSTQSAVEQVVEPV